MAAYLYTIEHRYLVFLYRGVGSYRYMVAIEKNNIRYQRKRSHQQSSAVNWASLRFKLPKLNKWASSIFYD